MWKAAVVSYLFKRVTPLQRRWLLLKTFPEAVLGVVFLCVEKNTGGICPSFVIVANLLAPGVIFLMTRLLYEPLRYAFWSTLGLDPGEVSRPAMEAEKISYFGHVDPERDVCVVSFPGKYTKAWDLCISGRHRMSVACVFFVTPEEGYGQHSTVCRCKELYGERNPEDFGYKDVNNPDPETAAKARAEFDKNEFRPHWGCKWFEAWLGNLEKARAQNQTLIVYYFRGQVGQGEVDWPGLGQAELWDQKGLGGSQKGEVAWLKKNNYEFLRKDVADLYEVLDEFWA